MNDVFDELENQLRGAVRARRRTRPPWLRRGHRRTAAVVLVAMLVVTAGALAAGGVIRIGAPAEPHESSFYALRGGGIVKGTARLLAISTPDPAGGPPWSMRVLSTKRGEGCVQVGRLLDGKLGAIGRDSAFHDDGLFHEFALDTFGAERACTLLDGNDRVFLNAVVGDIPASAWRGNYADKGCVPRTAGAYERFAEDGKRKPYPVCSQAEERNLYYGLLGPAAKSITYALDGHTHTQPTTGPEGAYLLVTKASPTQLFNFNAGGTQDVIPVDGPITELHYRNGATCHLTARSWIGGKDACTPELKVPVGWVPPRMPAPSAAQVASPVHVRLIHRPHGGYEAILRFTSRVAIDKAHSSYTVQWHETGQPPQVHTFTKPNPAFPAAGQSETTRMGSGLLRGLHPGLISGEVIYQDQTGPGNLEEAGGTIQHTVGRFTLTVP
ncbi:MAG TPA: hypothetical protein VGG98_05560 [Solirubrobacteraceae bacterium]